MSWGFSSSNPELRIFCFKSKVRDYTDLAKLALPSSLTGHSLVDQSPAECGHWHMREGTVCSTASWFTQITSGAQPNFQTPLRIWLVCPDSTKTALSGDITFLLQSGWFGRTIRTIRWSKMRSDKGMFGSCWPSFSRVSPGGTSNSSLHYMFPELSLVSSSLSQVPFSQ